MRPWLIFQLLTVLPGALASAYGGTTTPAGCRKLKTDVDWPKFEVWEAELPGVTPTNSSTDDGPLPDYRLQVKSVSDVQKAVRFATKHNIRLTVLTTGHDGLARNDAGSGLIIDLSLFDGVRVMESYLPTKEGIPFVEPGTEPNVIAPQEGVQAAVSFGPARAGLQLNYAVSKSGLFTVSGAAATVAVGGGWGQNGGYGPLTAQYGLGVDQWLEALIVTPDGELRVANKDYNSDLFWAIRGGGGGTFGVVVQITWKAYPVVPMTGFNWYINSTLNESNPETGLTPTSVAVEYLLSELPGLQEKGISAYFYIHPNTIRCFAIHPGELSGVAKANAVWGPILEKLQSFPGMTPFQTRPFTYSNYKEYFDTTYGPLVPQPTTPQSRRSRGVLEYDSRLLAAEHLQSPNITYALRGTRGDIGILACAPGSRFGNGSDVAANPGWRKAVALVVSFKTNTTNLDGLRELAPDMGSYINEGSVSEVNWTASFWGSNYPRLSQIKREIDPNMTFWVSPGINADYMKAVDGRACLVDPIPTEPGLIPPVTDRRHEANTTLDGGFLFGETELNGKIYPAPGTEIGLQEP